MGQRELLGNERLRAALAAAGGPGVTRLGKRWRLRERPYPTDASPVCLVAEFYDDTSGWVARSVLDPDGDGARSAWAALPYGANWGPQGDAAYHDGGYRLGVGGKVELRGLCRITDTAGSLTIGTLPAGHRPAKALIFSAPDNGGLTRWLTVTAAGDIVLANSAGMVNGWWISLAGISFEAEQ